MGTPVYPLHTNTLGKTVDYKPLKERNPLYLGTLKAMNELTKHLDLETIF